MANVGINVIETDGTATPALRGAQTSVAGFVITTQRGPVGEAVSVTSFEQFRAAFGGIDPSVLGPHLVQGFFENGGTRAWISRAVPRNANERGAAAAGILKAGADAAAPALLEFEAGSRGTADRGTWANGYAVTTAPSLVSRVTDDLTKTGATVRSANGFTKGDKVFVNAKQAANSKVVTLTNVDVVTRHLTWTEELTLADFDADAMSVVSTDFDLAVYESDPATMDIATPLEQWARLSLDSAAATYVCTQVNDSGRGSKYVRVEDKRAAADRKAARAPDATAVLLGGTAQAQGAAIDYAGDAAARTGIRAFDTVNIQLLAVDTSDADVTTVALGYCENRGDCMFVGALPERITVAAAIRTGLSFQGKKVYGALYYPWVYVPDATPGGGGRKKIPPTGHVLGVYARIATTRGIQKAPAGDDARLLGVVDVETTFSDADHTALVKEGSVNGIRPIPGAGIVVDASRTLSTDTRWLYVNVRLLFNYVKASLRDGLRWVRQEPNRDQLWDAVKYGTVRPFLLGMWRRGAFGTGEPDDVFTIVCDATNNPPEEVDQGNFNLTVLFYPSKPAETIVITVGQQPSGGSAAEA